MDGGGYDLSTGDIAWRELYLTCSLVVEVAGTLAQHPDQPLKISGEFFANTGVHGPIELVQGPVESGYFDDANQDGLQAYSKEPPAAPSKPALGDGPWAPPPAPMTGSQLLQQEAASESTTAHERSPAVSPSEALSPLTPQPTPQLSDEAALASCCSSDGDLSLSAWVDEPGALCGVGSIPVEGSPAWRTVASTPTISASGSAILERPPPLGSDVTRWELASEKTEDQWPWLGDNLTPAPRRVSFGSTELHTFDLVEGEREFVLPSCVNAMNLMFFYDDDSDEDAWEQEGERTPRISTTGSA